MGKLMTLIMRLLMTMLVLLVVARLLAEHLDALPALLVVPAVGLFVFLVIGYILLLTLEFVGNVLIGSTATAHMMGTLAADIVRGMFRLLGGLIVGFFRLLTFPFRR